MAFILNYNVVAVSPVYLQLEAIEGSTIHYRAVSRKGIQEMAQIDLLVVGVKWSDLGLCTFPSSGRGTIQQSAPDRVSTHLHLKCLQLKTLVDNAMALQYRNNC